jgi:uncharacterized membrane protein
LVAPAEYTQALDKDKGSFEVTITREKVEGEVKLSIEGAPEGVTVAADPIAKDKDKGTVNVAIDKAKAKAGTSDLKIVASSGETKTDAAVVKLKIVEKGGGDKTAKITLSAPEKVDGVIKDKKGSFELKVTRDNASGEIKLTYKGEPKGVTFKTDSIAAGKDSVTVDFAIAEDAKAGDYDVTIHGMVGDAKADAKTKLVLK